MDRRGALAQRPRATARPNGEDLGDHGQRHLLRPVGADVEPDGPVHPPFLYLRLGGEGAEDALSALARPEHPDVRRRRLEERPYVRQIVREVVGHDRSEEHTSELQSPCNLVCRLLLEKKKKYLNKLVYVKCRG